MGWPLRACLKRPSGRRRRRRSRCGKFAAFDPRDILERCGMTMGKDGGGRGGSNWMFATTDTVVTAVASRCRIRGCRCCRPGVVNLDRLFCRLSYEEIQGGGGRLIASPSAVVLGRTRKTMLGVAGHFFLPVHVSVRPAPARIPETGALTHRPPNPLQQECRCSGKASDSGAENRGHRTSCNANFVSKFSVQLL